ncbi:MAG: hypothetical protein IPK83_12605 [Planctomycetes bacterium]|nr:hypothetical protein [Planctomycetota bacterium]
MNAKHKGAAEFRVLEGIDHGLNAAEDMEDSYLTGNNGGEHSDAVAEAVIGWLKQKTKKAS